MLLKLPGAIHKAGVLLTALDIAVSPLENYAVLVPNEEDRNDLTAAVQKLKIFDFHPRSLKVSTVWPAREPDEMENLGRF